MAIGIALSAPRDLWITNKVQAAIVSVCVAIAFAWFYQPVAQAKHVLDRLDGQRQQDQAQIDRLFNEVQAKEAELVQLRAQVDGDGGQVAQLQRQLSQQQQQLDNRYNQMKKTAEKLMSDKDKMIQDQGTEILELSSQLKIAQSKVQEQQREIANVRSSLNNKAESSSRQQAADANTQQLIQSAVASVQQATALRRGSTVQDQSQSAGASATPMPGSRSAAGTGLGMGMGMGMGRTAQAQGAGAGMQGKKPLAMQDEEPETSDMATAPRRRSPARTGRMALGGHGSGTLTQQQGQAAQPFVPQPRAASAGPAPVSRPVGAKSVVASGIYQLPREEEDDMDSYAGAPYQAAPAGRAGAAGGAFSAVQQVAQAGPAGGNKKRGYPQYAVATPAYGGTLPLQQLPNAANAGGTGMAGKATQQLFGGASSTTVRRSPGRIARAQNV